MVGIDTNILVYAHRQDLPQHAVAREILERFINGTKPWALAWPSIYEFYRVVTHPRVLKVPSRREEVLKVVDVLHQTQSLFILAHGPAHKERLRELSEEADAMGNLAFDLQIAAIFMEHGIEEIMTNDADFRRFKAFRIINPF